MSEVYLHNPSQMDTHYKAAPNRYERMQFRRCGNSGLKLPLLSLGLWQNFGGEAPYENARAMILYSFDSGITHFDLGNNYGRPPGSSEETLGKVIRHDLKKYRDEIIVSTKAGYDMWPGPYGEWGSRKYLIASLDQSLSRLGLDYVDIFYSHRLDPETPLIETAITLADIVRQGKALYVGISSYDVDETSLMADCLQQRDVPFIVHQPSYSMFNRWIEHDLLHTLGDQGIGCIVFSVLEQGLLSNKYLDDTYVGGRMNNPSSSLKPEILTEDIQMRLRALNEIAIRRDQTLSQMALAWVLCDPCVTSAIMGASSIRQIEENVDALDHLEFTEEELTEINKYAEDCGITLWPPNC